MEQAPPCEKQGNIGEDKKPSNNGQTSDFSAFQRLMGRLLSVRPSELDEQERIWGEGRNERSR